MKRRYTALWLMLWLLLGLVAGCGNQEEAQGGQQTPDSQQEEQTDPKDDGADQPEDSKEEPQTPAGQGSRLEPAEEAAAQATAQGITQQGIYWRQGEDGNAMWCSTVWTGPTAACKAIWMKRPAR